MTAQALGVSVPALFPIDVHVPMAPIAQSVLFSCSAYIRIVIERLWLYRKLLNYLGTKNILATFFVVGSRVVERPAVLIEEYMAGHEISVHTWSHHARLYLLGLCCSLLMAYSQLAPYVHDK